MKFHFKTQQGHKHWTNSEATEIVGRTRESTQEDLFNAIELGDFPKLEDAGADHAGSRTWANIGTIPST